jgi:antitoxin YefM
LEVKLMPTVVTSYTQARAKLASLCNLASSTREPVIIKRRNGQDVAIVSLDELEGLLEAAHLLASPRNAERLLRALNRAKSRSLSPRSIEQLKKKVGLAKQQ